MISAIVVDTNVVSLLFKRDTRAELYRPHLTGRILVLSFMSLAEIDRWTLERNWREGRRKRMQQFLNSYIVYPYDRELCRKWAEVTVSARRRGRPIDTADAWIAATALLHDLPLVTHNRRHYDQIDGLRVISETPP